MDRNREARRASSLAATNGLSRRRQRSSSLRDSPEEDGSLELQETARLRDRTSVKKDRDRDRDHRDRERDRERDRDRSSRSKRRRGDRLMHGNHRENGNGGDESTEEESVNDDEDEDDDDGTGSLAMLPPNPPSSSLSSSMSNHLHRKSFPPAAAKVYRAPPTWKAADEMIGVSVPRKARSASTKRSHECWMLGGNGGVSLGEEQVHRQASTSPVRTSLIAAASSPVAAISPPSSSNVSARKKMKPNGPKQRPPKTSSKSSSSFHQDEIEFEIAEVLYGLRQNQGPSKQEGNDSVKFDSKSRIPSPLSNSPQPHSSGIPPQSSSCSAAPLTAVVPKRKKPRPVRCEDENPEFFGVRNGGGSSTMKAEIDQAPKVEFSLTNLEKDSGSAVENGVSYGFAANSQANPPAEPPLESALKPETANSSESKPSIEATESRDAVMVKEEAPKEPTSGHRLDENCVDAAPGTKAADSTASGIENQREDKYQIDLMAPPERESEVDFDAGHPTKPAVSDVETEKKEDEKGVSLARDGVSVEEHEEKKVKTVVEESDSQKSLLNRDKMVDLQLDLERHDRDSVTAGTNKLHQQVQKQHLQSNTTEKIAQSNSYLPLPMSVASWPGGIPPMGYMGPLPGVVPMDGSAVPSMAVQPPRSIFSQPRPKRGATHCYIARNISYHQQFTRMNPFWPGASGSASLYGKPCNLNVMANTELQGSVAPVKNLNSMQDNKAQSLAIFAGKGGKDKCSQTAHAGEAAQRKQQILLQQTLPPGTPTNMLHGPAFIFPLNQQQAAAAAAAAASARSGAVKSPTPGIAASLSMSTSASVSSAPAAAAAAATAMSFSYPNMTANETQYLAILQNNGYQFPIPTHVGAPPPAYRGTHPQPMPFVGGSFYSSQMLHPSQQQQQPPAQPQQTQQVHQNASISSGSSSSQKNVQNQQQQQRPHGSGLSSGGSGNLQAFPTPKNHRPLQPMQQQQHQQVQQQQQHNQHMASLHQARQHDAEMGGQDSPSTADSRVSRANISVYGQNFPIPIHPSNFALMTPPSASSAGGAHGDKRQQQQQGLKPGVEPPHPSHAFAMSFASVSGAGTASGIDISSMAQNNAILQSLPEHARHNYQIMAATAAAQVAQHKKNYRPEEGKNGAGDASSNAEEERKVTSGKASATLGQSIAFSRPDITEADNSSGNINHGSVPSRASSSISASNSHLQQRHHQHQQPLQQMLLLQKQQQQQPYAAAAGRSKTAAATSNGIVYSEHLPSSSSMAAKFPNALSALPQNLVHSSSSTAQSSQWKNAPRPSTSQVASPSLPSSSTPPSLKTVPQQQVRTQQAHTQISFGGNTKSSSTTPQGQQSPSSSMLVCSPTSSVLKGGAGGSPRTGVATSTGSKTVQASTLSSSQQGKNSPSMPTRKSSPVGGRNVASSILGNHHIASSSSTGSRTQLHQQQQQQQQTHQQISKQAMHQAQLFFSHPYVQAQQADAAQAQHSSNASSMAPATSANYMQRWRPEQQQQPQGPAVTLSGATTCDPAKAVAAPASKVKGGGLPSQGLIHATQFAAAAAAAAAQSSGNPLPILPAGFPYVQSIPQAVQLKPAEQKEPAA